MADVALMRRAFADLRILAFALFFDGLDHFQVLLKMWLMFSSKRLQFGIVAALGIAFEQRDCVFMCRFLVAVILPVKVRAFQALELVKLAFVRLVHFHRHVGFDLAG